MFEVSHIFVPVDTSRSSMCALRLAQSLRLASRPKLEVFHVLPTLPDYMRSLLFPYAAMGEDALEIEYELTMEARQKLEVSLELPAHASLECVMGSEREVIADAMLRTPANLTIMGAFGHGGPRPHAIGSTASHVIRSATHPVLLTRDLQPTPTIRHILCALDLSPHSHTTLEVAISLALELDARLSTIFVLPDPLANDPHNLLSSHIKHAPDQILARERSKLDALFERCFQMLDVPFPQRQRAAQMWRQRHALSGPVGQTIARQADHLDADLIVLGAAHAPEAPRPGATCLEVLHHATTHMLVVPNLPHPIVSASSSTSSASSSSSQEG